MRSSCSNWSDSEEAIWLKDLASWASSSSPLIAIRASKPPSESRRAFFEASLTGWSTMRTTNPVAIAMKSRSTIAPTVSTFVISWMAYISLSRE